MQWPAEFIYRETCFFAEIYQGIHIFLYIYLQIEDEGYDMCDSTLETKWGCGETGDGKVKWRNPVKSSAQSRDRTGDLPSSSRMPNHLDQLGSWWCTQNVSSYSFFEYFYHYWDIFDPCITAILLLLPVYLVLKDAGLRAIWGTLYQIEIRSFLMLRALRVRTIDFDHFLYIVMNKISHLGTPETILR